MACSFFACACGSVVIPQRYVLAFMAFLSIISCYNMRLGLHVAITEIAAPILHTGVETSDVCPGEVDNITYIKGGIYNWTEKQQGIILSSFFLGYIITHLPGGMLADKFGGRWVLAMVVLLSSFLSFLTPAVIQNFSWIALLVIRFLLGICQGPLFPAAASLLSQWVPQRERSTLGGMVFSGIQLGAVCGNLFSGLMIHAFRSWPVVFYVWGITGLIWTAFFHLFCYSKPSQHPFITAEEQQYLDTEIGPVRHFKTPWKPLLKEPALWALIAIQVGHDWITYIYIVYLPKFFKSVLKFNVGLNAIVTGTAFFIMWVSGIVTGYISDYGINHNCLSVIHMRKLYALISGIGPSACSLMSVYVGCNTALVVAFLWTAMIFMGPWFPGPKVNNLDLSVNFSGVIMSLTNGLGVISGIITPYLIAVIAHSDALSQWQQVFWLASFIVMVTLAVFIIWGSGTRCKWDLEPTET